MVYVHSSFSGGFVKSCCWYLCSSMGIFVVAGGKGTEPVEPGNHCPRLSVTASVVSKRTSISRHSHPNAGDACRGPWFPFHYRSYCATFQVESGDRMGAPGRQGLNMGCWRGAGKTDARGTRYLGERQNVRAGFDLSLAAHAARSECFVLLYSGCKHFE